uniref:Uncharacterized protein n=1 Tax=Wuchereria bancrofti TaxID=6293 RepID=A0AAF5PHN2_WUCBA
MVMEKIKEQFATGRRTVVQSQIELLQSVNCTRVFDIRVERKRNVRSDATSRWWWIQFNLTRPSSPYDLRSPVTVKMHKNGQRRAW